MFQQLKYLLNRPAFLKESFQLLTFATPRVKDFFFNILFICLTFYLFSPSPSPDFLKN